MDRSDRNLLSVCLVIFLIFLCIVTFIFFGEAVFASTSRTTTLYIDDILVHSCTVDGDTGSNMYFGAADHTVVIRCDCGFDISISYPYNFAGYGYSSDAEPFWTFDHIEESGFTCRIGGLASDNALYKFYSSYSEPDPDMYCHTFVYLDDELAYVAYGWDDTNPGVTLSIGEDGLITFTPDEDSDTLGGYSGSYNYSLSNFLGLRRFAGSEPDEDLKVGCTTRIPSQSSGDMHVYLYSALAPVERKIYLDGELVFSTYGTIIPEVYVEVSPDGKDLGFSTEGYMSTGCDGTYVELPSNFMGLSYSPDAVGDLFNYIKIPTWPGSDIIELYTVRSDHFTQVLSHSSDYSGTYFISFLTDERNGYIFSGLDQSNNWYKLGLDDGLVPTSWYNLRQSLVKIAKYGDGYSIQLLGGEKAGKYIYASTGKQNKILYSDTPQQLSIFYDGTNMVIRDGEKPFQFNAASNNLWFRFFGAKPGGQSAISLFRLDDGTTLPPASSVSYEIRPGKWIANSYLTAWPDDYDGEEVLIPFASGGFSYSSMKCDVYLPTGGQALCFGDTPVYSYGLLDKDKGWINSAYSTLYFNEAISVSHIFYDWFLSNFSYSGFDLSPDTYTTTVNIYDQTGRNLLDTVSFTGTSIAPFVTMRVSSGSVIFSCGDDGYFWTADPSFVGLSLKDFPSSVVYPYGVYYFGGSSGDVTIDLVACYGYTFSVNVYNKNGVLLANYSQLTSPCVDVYWHCSSSSIGFRVFKDSVFLEDYAVSAGHDISKVFVTLDGETSEFVYTGSGGENGELQYHHLTSSLDRDYYFQITLSDERLSDNEYQDGVLGWFERVWDGLSSLPGKVADLIVPSPIRNLFSSINFSLVTGFFSTAWDNVTSLFGLADLFDDPAGPFGWLKE